MLWNSVSTSVTKETTTGLGLCLAYNPRALWCLVFLNVMMLMITILITFACT